MAGYALRMKIIFTLIIFLLVSLYANENWIKIEPINSRQTPKPTQETPIDINLSTIEPVNKMMKNVALIKQIIDATNKKEKQTKSDKNWFVFQKEERK